VERRPKPSRVPTKSAVMTPPDHVQAPLRGQGASVRVGCGHPVSTREGLPGRARFCPIIVRPSGKIISATILPLLR
jgi:hypothetical protein